MRNTINDVYKINDLLTTTINMGVYFKVEFALMCVSRHLATILTTSSDCSSSVVHSLTGYRRYLNYSEADFEVFRPAGATRCTDVGQILRGGGDQRSPPPPPRKISPTSVQRQGCTGAREPWRRRSQCSTNFLARGAESGACSTNISQGKIMKWL